MSREAAVQEPPAAGQGRSGLLFLTFHSSTSPEQAGSSMLRKKEYRKLSSVPGCTAIHGVMWCLRTVSFKISSFLQMVKLRLSYTASMWQNKDLHPCVAVSRASTAHLMIQGRPSSGLGLRKKFLTWGQRASHGIGGLLLLLLCKVVCIF